MRAFCESVMTAPLNPLLPLWEVYVINGYREAPDSPPATVLVWRIHHCIADGSALGAAIMSLSDEAVAMGKAAAEKRAAASSKPPRPTDWKAVGLAVLLALPRLLLFLAAALAVGVKYAMMLCGREPVTAFKVRRGTPLTGEKSLAWTSSISMPDVKRVGKLCGGATVNDVALAAVAQGLRRCGVRLGADLAGVEVRAAVPVSVRPANEVVTQLGNQFGFITVQLPLHELRPLAALKAIKRRMDVIKRTPEQHFAFLLARAAGALPRRWIQHAFESSSMHTTLCVSNVRGPDAPLHIDGRKVVEVAGFLPPPPGIALGIAVFSYAGNVMFSVAADNVLNIPAPDLIRDIVAGLADMSKAGAE